MSPTFTMIITLASAVTTISAAVMVFVNLGKAARRPLDVQNERITALEVAVKELQAMNEKQMEYFAKDKARIDAISDGSAVMQRALLALLSHAIDGNNEQQMRDTRDELQKYLTEQRV